MKLIITIFITKAEQNIKITVKYNGKIVKLYARMLNIIQQFLQTFLKIQKLK